MFYALVASTLLASTASADIFDFPAARGYEKLNNAIEVTAGKPFDGGMKMFDRGVQCTGQTEGGTKDAVFVVHPGGVLSNVIIGPNQIEGIHCMGACTLKNVWWDKVCEDAFSIKKQKDNEVTRIIGGGARHAEDKVIQHNGGGTIELSDFVVDDFGKLYRSCGNCRSQQTRHFKFFGIKARKGKVLAGINQKFGDTVTEFNPAGRVRTNSFLKSKAFVAPSSSFAQDVKIQCELFDGNNSGKEPKSLGPCPGFKTLPATPGQQPTPTPPQPSRLTCASDRTRYFRDCYAAIDALKPKNGKIKINARTASVKHNTCRLSLTVDNNGTISLSKKRMTSILREIQRGCRSNFGTLVSEIGSSNGGLIVQVSK